MDVSQAQASALWALKEIVEDKEQKPELRLEAAKLILNRPRFFVQKEFPER